MGGACARRLRWGSLFYNNPVSEDPSLQVHLSHTLSDITHDHMTQSPTLKDAALQHCGLGSSGDTL